VVQSSKFSLLSLSCLVVANTIGAGVYTTSGFTLDDLGSREAVLAVWVLASILALAGAYSFGVLARAIPKSGGEYLYLSRLLHPGAGFIAGWVSLIAAFAGAEAYAAITMMEYLELDHLVDLHVGQIKFELLLSLVLLIALAALHGTLVKLGTILQNLTVIAKALFILVIVVLASFLVQAPTDVAQAVEHTPWDWPVNLMWVSLSFTGFNSAIYVAEEADDPRRNVPRALLIGTVVTAVLYLLINAAMLYSAPIEKLAGVPNIAMVSADAMGGARLSRAVQVLVLLSLFTLMSGMAVAGPRVVVKMSEDGFLPPLTLRKAAFIQCLLALVMTFYSDLVNQLTYLSLTLSLTSAVTVACIFLLPREERGHIVIPLVYIVGTLVAAAASVKTVPLASLAALATILSGGIIYALFFASKGPDQEPLNPERTLENRE